MLQIIIIMVFFIIVVSIFYLILLSIVNLVINYKYDRYTWKNRFTLLKLLKRPTALRILISEPIVQHLSKIRCSRSFHSLIIFALLASLGIGIYFLLAVEMCHGLLIPIILLLIIPIEIFGTFYLVAKTRFTLFDYTKGFLRWEIVYPAVLVFLPLVALGIAAVFEILYFNFPGKVVLFLIVAYGCSLVSSTIWFSSRASYFTSKELYEVTAVQNNLIF